MRGGVVVVLAISAACGRVRFDEHIDGSLAGDTANDDAAADATMIDMSLLLHYKLDDLTGSTTADTVSGRLASCNAGECPTLTSGIRGQALDFSGGQRGLRIPWDNALQTPTAFTVAAWVRPADTTGGAIWSRPFFDAVGDWNTWQLELLTGNLPTLTTSLDGPSPIHDQITGPAITAGAWSHLAGTWDGTTRRLYVAGVERGMAPWSACAMDSNPLVIALDINNGLDDLWFAGAVDDVRLYNRALSASEIAALAAP